MLSPMTLAIAPNRTHVMIKKILCLAAGLVVLLPTLIVAVERHVSGGPNTEAGYCPAASGCSERRQEPKAGAVRQPISIHCKQQTARRPYSPVRV
jgi:hypothetical protein